MDSRPIGIFDSGLGGLTALRALRRFLPDILRTAAVCPMGKSP